MTKLSFEDQLAAYEARIGASSAAGTPVVTPSGVHQWVRVAHPRAGDVLFYRDHRAGLSARDHHWTSGRLDVSVTPEIMGSFAGLDEAWRKAVDEFDLAHRIRAWRRDDDEAAYYSAPWNVDGLIEGNGIAWVYGQSGSYKSVLAMGLACSVATGRDWCGRKVRQGPVLYISAEGGAGILTMRSAWEAANAARADHLVIHIGAPDIARLRVTEGYDEDGPVSASDIAQRLNEIKAVTGRHAALIVIDTYAQTSGGDMREDVSAYERKLRRLIAIAAPGASALVIDHTTKEGSSWIGSNAKLANMDMVAMVSRKDDSVVLSMGGGRGKIKNAAPFEDIRMKASLVGIGRRDAYGREVSGPVLVRDGGDKTDREALALDLIGEGISYADLRTAWHGHPALAELSHGTRKVALTRAVQRLREDGLVRVLDAPGGAEQGGQVGAGSYLEPA